MPHSPGAVIIADTENTTGEKDMSLHVKRVYVEILAGTTLDEAISEAVWVSKNNGRCSVLFKFNGCALNTKAGRTRIHEKYEKYCRGESGII